MSDIAVSVRGLSKAYRIAHDQEKHITLAETILSRLKNPLRRPKFETFWALKDVSFEVKKGEVVGIIGRNGAGKSTLLKVLSRITEPTVGEIDVYGRVGSLLEVGTGFHPELTGRENVFLNGAILGMSKAEIKKQFDAIVDFAGVEQFLDTPVKRYSSGMYVRLAFAVAAHLNPEILIVDEVLAVGDADFQKKCLGKMKDVADGGRTVLFVSHNMGAVGTLCTLGVELSRGEVRSAGPIRDVISSYLSKTGEGAGGWRREVPSKSSLSFERVTAQLVGTQPQLQLIVSMWLHSRGDHQPAFVAFDIADESGAVVMQALPELTGFLTSETTRGEVVAEIDLPPMIPGKYHVTLWAGPHNTLTLDEVERCFYFEITDTPTIGRVFPHSADKGKIVPHSRIQKGLQTKTV